MTRVLVYGVHFPVEDEVLTSLVGPFFTISLDRVDEETERLIVEYPDREVCIIQWEEEFSLEQS